MSLGKFVIGIDEVGRGPLAGPICVGAVIMPAALSRKDFRGLKDSKKLSAKQRGEWAARVRADARLSFATAMVGPRTIDKIGIVHAGNLAVARALGRLARFFTDVSLEHHQVLLDAGLRAPYSFKHQKSLIRGDETEVSIALASIVAKVKRDAHMERLAARYPEYGFELHKGYGTTFHIRAIRSFGPCELHRESFCRGIARGLHAPGKSL
ncbi:hypothetical protein A3F27_01365 [Candidatus Kaiserbacteria bacterium RIFCSPHIGHO2_12_FULL_53_13]|uniref:Ribonuclease HII n=1 Tax=Candidatus Kaiserbacteria bacterium RIFCSPHIGHO2_12_FULL_53_13 TaxID=1798502 RepID=A0A1F6E6G6_9BACT|nr:MAG: hypothetical protein A3F27_01365 [Candidatus Kaiserbacteria bacterium RIFCSPHIGHO2_12_FULL_53_13]OGG74202.1 MAG: hypothetical protein A3A37_00380 [Candidatus Kaiserbacteria bacterium RIFCSPLOWO2_01_FULL_52_36]